MIGVDIAGAKSLFLDRTEVAARMRSASRRALSRAGFLVRREARKSMRRRKEPAPPGAPPRVVRGHLKRHLYYVYDPQSQSVVVGPARLGRSRTPEVLERGGVARRRVRIAARPFMGPAYERERPKIPALWADSLARSKR